MSSSNNQSAETYIANGLTFNISDLDITAPKLNKSGGKSANILYKPTKKSLYVNMQVPMLTWGANVFRDPQSGKETYDLAIQFPRADYSSPETDILLAKFQALEALIKTEAVKNCMAWFNKKMTPELVDAAWTPMLKYAKDKTTGEALQTFTIVTTEAHALMREIHNTKQRMPILLTPQNEEDWLHGQNIELFAHPEVELKAEMV